MPLNCGFSPGWVQRRRTFAAEGLLGRCWGPVLSLAGPNSRHVPRGGGAPLRNMNGTLGWREGGGPDGPGSERVLAGSR
jgi:hypothetical protein